MKEKTLTHLTESGVHMVDVGDKPVVRRTATARGKINLKASTIDLIKKERIKKGNVLTTAQIAAIGAVKSTHHLIPLCHSLRISGVEMEALTGVSVGLLTIWDMVKSVEKDENGQYPSTNISDIVVVKKEKK